MIPLRIFIGSSSQSAKDMDLVASWLEQEGHHPLPWNNPNAFIPGKLLFQSLIGIANKIDAAIFIFAEDDQIIFNNQQQMQPRDNVLIEYGMFVGILGAERVIFCRKGSPKTASDLQGVLYVDISEGKQYTARMQIRDWLREVKDYINQKNIISVIERFNLPFQSLGKETLFRKGTELIKKAKHRIALVARTPILIVGHRPYDQSENPKEYELEQFNCYVDIAKAASEGNSLAFRCVANIDCIKREIEKINQPVFTKKVHSQIQEMYNLSRSSRDKKCQMRWQNTESLLAFLVADNHFIIWFKDRSTESVWITAENQSMADALYFISEEYSYEKTYDDIKQIFSI